MFTSVGNIPRKGIAGSEEIDILALRDCSQSGEIKEMAFSYWYISLTESEHLFPRLSPFLFFCSKLLFPFLCHFIVVIVAVG